MVMLHHTPGPFEAVSSVVRSVATIDQDEPLHAFIADCYRVRAKDAEAHEVCPFTPSEEAAANARLVALAPTAPHECDVPGCPGAETKRKLEAAAAVVKALMDERDRHIRYSIVHARELAGAFGGEAAASAFGPGRCNECGGGAAPDWICAARRRLDAAIAKAEGR